MGEPDLEQEAMISDFAEWAHWSARLYEKDTSTLQEHYAFYRSWPYSKLKKEWDNFFGRDLSNESM